MWRDQNFDQYRDRDFLSETNFSDTNNKTFFSKTKFSNTDTETFWQNCTTPLDWDPIGKKRQYFGINPKSIGINLVPSQSHAIPNPDQPPLRIFLKYQQFCTKKKLEFWDWKINFVYLSINRSNSFSESTVWDFFKKVKVGWVWLEIFWPVRFCHRKGTQVADCWLERSELRKSWNLQKARPVYESRHSTDFRTVYHLRNHY